MAKRNFLVIVVFLILFVLIVNAAEEGINESYNATNEAFLNHSNNTAANDTYNLSDTDAAFINESVETNNSVNASQNNLNSTNETKNINDTNYLNDTPKANNANLSNALTVESNDTGIEENQDNTNEIMAESSQALTDYASSDAVESEENKESATALTASFGVYLDIVG